MGRPAQLLWLAPAEADAGVPCPSHGGSAGTGGRLFCSHPLSSCSVAGQTHPLLQGCGNGQDSQRSGRLQGSAECWYADLVGVACAFNWVKGSVRK